MNEFVEIDSNDNHDKQPEGLRGNGNSVEQYSVADNSVMVVNKFFSDIKLENQFSETKFEMNVKNQCQSFVQMLSEQRSIKFNTFSICSNKSDTKIWSGGDTLKPNKCHVDAYIAADNEYNPRRMSVGDIFPVKHGDNLYTFSNVSNSGIVDDICNFSDITNPEFAEVSLNSLKPVLCDTAIDIQIRNRGNIDVNSEYYGMDKPFENSCDVQAISQDLLPQTLAIKKKETILMTTDSDEVKTEGGNMNGEARLTQGKLKDIMSYLEEVENTTPEILNFNHAGHNTSTKGHKERNELLTENIGSNEKEVMRPVDQEENRISQYVKTLELQLEDRERSLSLAREALSEKQEALQISKQKMEQKIRSCKKEYEDIILRHQKFIDQLIADKETLNEKCKSLVCELKAAETRYVSNIKASEERHHIDIQKVRAMLAAAEKLRREKWIENKTKKIKEMTVKGLEPELCRLSEKHEKELSELHTEHEMQLHKAQEEKAHELREQARQLQEEANQQQMEEIAYETARIKARFEKQVEELERSHEEERKKLLEDIAKQKENFDDERRKLMNDIIETKKRLNLQKCQEIKQVDCKYNESLNMLESKHQNEIKSLRQTIELEKASWIHDCEKKQKLYLLEKEAEIREEYKKNRNLEIEKAIEKLEEDLKKMKYETERACESKIIRLNEKHDSDVKELKVELSSVKNKFYSARNELKEKEDEIISLKTSIRQLEKEIVESQKVIERLSSERVTIKEIIRKEFLSQIMNLEEDNIKLREQMAEMRACHQMELAAKDRVLNLAALQKEHELQELYKRVKITISKKEKVINMLNLKYEAVLKQCSHLENLLEQHQRDHLFR